MASMKRFCELAVTAIVVFIGTQASAHHSTANFDYTKTVVLSGTVKQFQWTNPHSFIQVVVPDSKGEGVEWSIESGSPALERRLGWKPDMIKPGDKVSVTIAPVRSGGPSGTLRQITLPNGTVLYGPGNQGEVPGLPTIPSSTEGPK
jgi:hypothetical protein